MPPQLPIRPGQAPAAAPAYPYPQKPAEAGNELFLELLIDFLKRRGALAILLGSMLGFAFGSAVLRFLPVQYTAAADLQISAPEGHVLEHWRSSQMGIIQSERVLSRALDQADMKSLPIAQQSADPVAELKSLIKFDDRVGTNGTILRVQISGADPDEITTYCNAVVNAYTSEAQTIRNESSKGQEKGLENELQQAIAARDAKVKKRSDLMNAVGVQDDIKTKLLQLRTEHANKEKYLDDLRLKLVAEEGSRSAIEAREVDTITQADRATISQNRQVEDLMKEMRDAEKEANELKRLNGNGPEVAALKKQAQAFGERALALQITLEDGLIEARKQQKKEDLNKVDAAIAAIKKSVETYETERNSLTHRISGIEAKSQEESAITAEIRNAEQQIERFNNQLTRIRQDNYGAYVSLLGAARRPTAPSQSSKRLIISAGAGMGALGLVVLAFWLTDARKRLLGRPEHVQAFLGQPVIARLPTIPRGKRLPDDGDFQADNQVRRAWHAMIESVNALRIMLMFAPDRRGDGISTMMVTSANESEGKSTVIALLATSLARSGVKVVIVDCDLYRPTQHETFGLERSPGLSDVLLGKASIGDVIRETAYPGLFLVPAGEPLDRPEEHLSLERLRPIFDELKMQFPTVLIDSPPILPVFDSMILSRLADETMLAVMCNRSQVRACKQAVERLESIGVKPLGAVVSNSAPESRYGSSYYYDRRYSPRPSARALPADASSPIASDQGVSA
jgi:capsular exopolysaccharide synthesis family protein